MNGAYSLALLELTIKKRCIDQRSPIAIERITRNHARPNVTHGGVQLFRDTIAFCIQHKKPPPHIKRRR